MEYIILLIALIAIIWSADTLVAGAVDIARRYHVSDFVIGAVIVGIGTSCPELFVSSLGAWNGQVDVAIGNIVGSNIFNVLFILGITALVMPVEAPKENRRFELPFCIGVSVVLLLLAFNFFNGTEALIGRIDGLVLLALFATFMYISFRRDRSKGVGQKEMQTIDAPKPNLWVAVVKVVVGLGVLVTSCHYFVESAISIAEEWGVSEAFISITLIACGTSLPELAASVAAALKKNTQLALGNIIGSNIFNITFILGVCSQISPLTGGGITFVDYVVMIVASIMPLVLVRKGRLSRVAGAVMFAMFVAYNAYLIYNI
ncbi:MAG: calcium/sodium antiporter [Rikenellaceae bacterium]|nr:calcium/sodium antiporter [Rikenellaceae bacterium]